MDPPLNTSQGKMRISNISYLLICFKIVRKDNKVGTESLGISNKYSSPNSWQTEAKVCVQNVTMQNNLYRQLRLRFKANHNHEQGSWQMKFQQFLLDYPSGIQLQVCPSIQDDSWWPLRQKSSPVAAYNITVHFYSISHQKYHIM